MIVPVTGMRCSRRCAHSAGVGYSAYDLDWVIHALRVERVRGGDDPEDLVLDWRRGRRDVGDGFRRMHLRGIASPGRRE